MTGLFEEIMTKFFLERRLHSKRVPNILLKTRQQVPNGVTYAKPCVTKPGLNLITVLALTEMRPQISCQESPGQH